MLAHRARRFRAPVHGPFGLLLLTALLAGCGSPDPPRTVVLVTIDTLRADHLHFMGYPRPVSPFLDRLAAEGTVFEHTISSSSTTITSHASLFTSLHPAQHQMVRNGVEIHEGLVTMAEIFREEGWQTAAWTTTGFLKGIDDGFELFDARGEYTPADELVDALLGWVAEERDPERPALLWLHLFDVHEWTRPDRVPPEILAEVERIAPTGRELQDWLLEEHRLDLRSWRQRPRRMLAAIQRYDAQLLFVDRELERLQGALAEHGMLEESVWLVTSDHGEGLGAHRVLGHGEALFQDQLRVPMLFWSGGGAWRGGRIVEQVSHLDVLPTLAEITGVEIPAILRREDAGISIQGRSLVPYLEGESDRVEEPGWHYAQRRVADDNRISKGWKPGEMVAVYDGWWKYIHHEGGEGRLYDLRDDPRELVNLAEQQPEVRDRLARRAERWFAKMTADGEAYRRGDISPEFVEELEALGYL